MPRACVLDSDYPIRAILTGFLESRGYEVESYDDPSMCVALKADDAAEQFQMDLVICAVEMQTMTGFEFLGILERKQIKVKHVALIASHWYREDIPMAEKLGYKLFRRPIDIVELSDWLDKCNGQDSLNTKMKKQKQTSMKPKPEPRPGSNNHEERSK